MTAAVASLPSGVSYNGSWVMIVAAVVVSGSGGIGLADLTVVVLGINDLA